MSSYDVENSIHSVLQAQHSLPSETPRDAAPQIRDQTRHPNTFTDGGNDDKDDEDGDDEDGNEDTFLPRGSSLLRERCPCRCIPDAFVPVPGEATFLSAHMTASHLAMLGESPNETLLRWLDARENPGVPSHVPRIMPNAVMSAIDDGNLVGVGGWCSGRHDDHPSEISDLDAVLMEYVVVTGDASWEMT